MRATRDVGNYKIVIKAKDLNDWKMIKSVELPVCSKDLRIEDFFISDLNINGDINRPNSQVDIKFNLQKKSSCKINIYEIVVQIFSTMVRPYSLVSTIFSKSKVDLGLTYPISIPSVKTPNLGGRYEIVISLRNLNGNLYVLKRIPFIVRNNYNPDINYIDKCIQKYQRYFGNKSGRKYACHLGYKWNFVCQNTSGREGLELRLKNNRSLRIHRVTKMALDPNNKKWYFFYDDFRDGKKKWSPDELNLTLPVCD